MNRSFLNTFLGYIVILGGFTLLILAAGELVLRLVIALIALIIINYGMRLTGSGSMQTVAMRAWFSRMR